MIRFRVLLLLIVAGASVAASSASFEEREDILLRHFTVDAADDIFNGEDMIHFLIFTDPRAEGTNAILSAAYQAAYKYQGDVVFVTISVDESLDPDVLEIFEVKAENLPTMRMLVDYPDEELHHFVPSEEEDGGSVVIDYQGIISFVGTVLESSQIVSAPDEGMTRNGSAVVHIVGSSFKNEVLRSPLHSFVYLHTCDATKKACADDLWTVNLVAQVFQRVDSVQVVQMDTKANKYPAVSKLGVHSSGIWYWAPGFDEAIPPSKFTGKHSVSMITTFMLAQLDTTASNLPLWDGTTEDDEPASAPISYSRSSHVVSLGDSNLDLFLTVHPFVLVEFYAPWCGHCKSLEPHYEEAAQELANQPEVRLAKVDATVHLKAVERYGATSFPTLTWFRSGVALAYSGKRTSADITSFVRSHAITLTNVKTAGSVEEMRAGHASITKGVVVGFFSTPQGMPIMESLALEVAKRPKDAALAGFDLQYVDTSVCTDCKQDIGLIESVTGDAVVLLRKTDRNATEAPLRWYTETDDVTGMLKWLHLHSLPLVVHVDAANHLRVFEIHTEFVLLFFGDETPDEELESLLDVAGIAAQSYYGKICFLAVPAHREDAAKGPEADSRAAARRQMFEEFQLTEDHLPTMRVLDRTVKHASRKYRPGAAAWRPTASNLAAFVEAYLAGRARLVQRSERQPTPADIKTASGGDILWRTKNIEKVVGSTFESIVLDEEKDVFVLFYSHKCPQCRSMAPVWRNLARGFEASRNIVIATFNSLRNEHDAVGEIPGFPTLKLWPAHDKSNPQMYRGDRGQKELVEFMTKHCTHLQPGEPKTKLKVEAERIVERESREGSGHSEL